MVAPPARAIERDHYLELATPLVLFNVTDTPLKGLFSDKLQTDIN